MQSYTLTPDVNEFYDTVRTTIKEIRKGHRVQILVPRSISHEEYEGSSSRNWDELEEIQMDFRGSILNPDVFFVLRFDQKDESSDVTIDICHV